MQYLTYNLRGSRAFDHPCFDRRAGKIVALTLGMASLAPLPGQAAPPQGRAAHHAPRPLAAKGQKAKNMTAKGQKAKPARRAMAQAFFGDDPGAVKAVPILPSLAVHQSTSIHQSAGVHLAAWQTPAPPEPAPTDTDRVIPGQAAMPLKAIAVKPKMTLRQNAGPSVNDVTIDFVAADINDVLRALALQTRSNVVSGTDVKGTITVSLAHVSLDQALNMISKLSGFEYAKVGNSYVVGSPASISALTQGQIQSDYVHFDFSDAGDLMASLAKTFPAVRVSLVKPAAVTEESSGAGGGETKTIRRTGGVISVTGTIAEIASIKKYIADLETSFPESILKDIGTYKTDVYQIKYSSADDLQTVLSRLVPRLIVTPGPVQRQDGAGALQAPATADAGVVTTTQTTGAQPTGDASGTGAGGGTSSGTTAATTSKLALKPKVSTLLLTGADADIARAHSILDEIDIRPAQINFEAKITDLDVTLARDLGLTYNFGNAMTTIGETLVGTDTPTSTVFHDPYPNQLTKFNPLVRTPLDQFVTIGLKAAQTKGDARILATPNVSAIDGQPAGIFIGDNVTYISSITAGTTGQNIVTSTISAGVKLFIDGKVNNDGYITVNLHPEVSTYVLNATAGGAQLPTVSTREVNTTLRVHDGDIIALGGLARSSETKTSNQVPLLADIPIIGNLFRYDNKQRENRVLVIFLKVSIQKDRP